MKNLILLLTLSFCCTLAIAQPSNDNCTGATELCDNNRKSGDTDGATSQVCATCADGATVVGSACFQMVKTIWYSFTTNATGGNISVFVSNINNTTGSNGVSGTIYYATTPCNSATYTSVSNCVVNSNANFNLNGVGLLPNTTYYILMSSDSSTACTFDITLSGPGVELPASTITISNNIDTTIVCPEDNVTFGASFTNCTNPEIRWYVNGGQVASTNGIDPFVKGYFIDGDVVTAEIFCDCNPSSTSNALTINVHPYITVDAGGYVTIPFGASTQLNGTGAVSYSWAPANTLSNPNISNPIATPLGFTTYTLTGYSAEGCRFFDDVTVAVIDSIFVPNTFTPNSDGVNDTWEIKLIDLFPKAEITVFDRWGQIVYKTIGYPRSKRWDGTRNGKPLPATTYYYTISLSIDSEEERLRTGSVTIIY